MAAPLPQAWAHSPPRWSASLTCPPPSPHQRRPARTPAPHHTGGTRWRAPHAPDSGWDRGGCGGWGRDRGQKDTGKEVEGGCIGRCGETIGGRGPQSTRRHKHKAATWQSQGQHKSFTKQSRSNHTHPTHTPYSHTPCTHTHLVPINPAVREQQHDARRHRRHPHRPRTMCCCTHGRGYPGARGRGGGCGAGGVAGGGGCLGHGGGAGGMDGGGYPRWRPCGW